MQRTDINWKQVETISKRTAERIIETQIRHGKRCPECSSTSTESNGSSEYRCCKCDHRWGFEGGRDGEPYGFC